MKNRIENVTEIGRVPEELRLEHQGFKEWDSFTSPRDHAAIVQVNAANSRIIRLFFSSNSPIKSNVMQILLDHNHDTEGHSLPKLVYMAREKRPEYFHNFKAGAMNAPIRVSSMISNGPIILNVDCDMYSNSSDTIRDALCFFLDEEKGHEIAFVLYPQCFENITQNEVYGGSLRVLREVDFHGLDGVGGPLYVGTGCFHRRAILLGKSFSDRSTTDWKIENDNDGRDIKNIESLASCTFESDTQWGKEALNGLSQLGDRFRMLKAKEVELFMQNKELYGEKQHLSQQEYIRGISACNFDMGDLKNESALIQDYDEISNTEEPNANSKQQNWPNDVGLPAERLSLDISDHSDNGSHHELYKRLDGAWTETKATSEKVKETLGIGKPESTKSSSSSANESSEINDDEQSTDKEDKKQESGYASCVLSFL
ncbi:hypothetical protein L2E82_32496 [Cichorium intybus]|uniref:Uncharacterized protein n=1 Tax=Cichorium intybus TaxID=13427 RepID=A0ACB9BHD2_CICIN|nr:hypothetical protein L2E82_32496 [Cichorium intybus]